MGSEPGEVKRAFVSDLRLDVGADPHGVFYLDVDDFDRAMKFGVNFLAEGPLQVPREDGMPAIRRMLAEGRPVPRRRPAAGPRRDAAPGHRRGR